MASARRTDAALAAGSVLMVLCCAVGPAVIGAFPGTPIGGWVGIALVVAATAAFVVGVAIEHGRESGHHERSAPEATSEPGSAHSETGEAASVAERRSAEPREELRPLGVDVEAWPFVAVAAVASLALAAAAFSRPRAAVLLALVGAAMLAFAALDVREVVQLDDDAGGLALLAGTVAALHLAAAAVAGIMRA